ncbi:MAG: hypothetical protein MRY74_10195 [Neomegalonema sp.]|nr:hypothetical protein [Neomegalonema sp.]
MNTLKQRILQLWAQVLNVFVTGFTLLSFYGTWIGLAGIINLGDDEKGTGDIVVFILVGLLTLVMVYALQQFLRYFGSYKSIIPFVMYVPLLIFSISFGFAFYWQRLNANDEAVTASTSGLSTIEQSIDGAKDRLATVRSDMTALAASFSDLAKVEREKGGTCGDGSPPGAGPRMRHRDRRSGEISRKVSELASRFDRLDGPLKELADSRAAIEAYSRLPQKERTAVKRGELIKKAEATAASAASKISLLAGDPLIASTAATFETWAKEYTDPSLVRRDDPAGSRYKCVSPAAATSLRAAATSLRSLPKVDAPRFEAFVGSDATKEALFRVALTLWPFGQNPAPATPGTSGAPAPTVVNIPAGIGDKAEAEFRKAAEKIAKLEEELKRKEATPTAKAAAPAATKGGLKQADYFPLFVASFVDFMLLMCAAMSEDARRRLGAAERLYEDSQKDSGVVLEVLIKSDQLLEREEWRRLSRYLLHDDGDYYFVVPPRTIGGQTHDGAQNLTLALLGQDVIAETTKIDADRIREKFKAGHTPEGLTSIADSDIENLEAYRFRKKKLLRLVYQIIGDKQTSVSRARDAQEDEEKMDA